MKKHAESSVDLHPILAERWSPRSYDPNFQISNEDLLGILEAARWSPSWTNNQPWRFIVAKKGSPEFENISNKLSGFNKVWAPKASLYLLIAAQTTNPDDTARPMALYDSGIASANITTEAIHRGLVVHQIGGFDTEAVARDFKFPLGLRPLTVLVIGKQAPADQLPDQALIDREKSKRERLPLYELVINAAALNS